MNKYAIYLRKSRADIEAESKGEMETLARHENLLLELAKKMNITIEGIYKEIVSGETINARPVVQHLLNEVEQGLWTGVLVMEIERLARGDTIDQGIVARSFKVSGTKIITPIKIYDPNNEFDEEYFEFGLFMSRREYKTINRRIQRGRTASAKEGKYIVSVPPYGYNKVKITNDKGYTLEKNKNESNVVKLIFDLYIKGKGMSVIANELDNLNIKPKYRNTWSKSTISDILENPVYIGKIRWSYENEKKTYLNGKLTKHRVINNDYIYVDGIHPQIIDVDTFNKAQQIRKLNTRQCTKKNLSLKNPLTGLIYCKKCGSIMNRLGANHHANYDTLRCSNKYCNNISAPIYLIEQKLLEELSNWLKEYEININKINPNDNYINTEKENINSIKNEIIQIENQILNTYNLLERNIYTDEIFIKRNKELSEHKEKLILTLKDLEARYHDYALVSYIKEIFIPQVKKILYEYFNIKSINEKNYLLKKIMIRADYLKEKRNGRGNLNNENFILELHPLLPKNIPIS